MGQPEKIDFQHPTRSRIARAVEAIPPSGIRAFFDLVIGRDDVISLGVGEPDFVTPWRVRESSMYHISRGETCYTSNAGLLSLRKVISHYLASRFSVTTDPETEVLITVGASEAIDVALRAILNPGDEVIIWEPCFVCYAPLVSIAGGKPVMMTANGEEGFRFDIEHLKTLITPKTKAIFINYPNNPTGATIGREDLTALARLAAQKEIIIISDEIYAELTHDSKHISIASIPEATDWTITISGFSKAFAMTGWRLGYAVGPQEIIAAMTKIHQYSMMCAPVMAQRAAETAMSETLDEMKEMCEVYRQRRNVMVEGLNAIGLPCHKPAGAFYAFPSIRHTGLDSVEFCRRLLEEEHVAIVPGNAFGESGEGHVRLAYAVGFETIEKALAGIGKFLKRL